jgi:hypothetical protein
MEINVIEIQDEIFEHFLSLNHPEGMNTVVMPSQIREVHLGPKPLHWRMLVIPSAEVCHVTEISRRVMRLIQHARPRLAVDYLPDFLPVDFR